MKGIGEIVQRIQCSSFMWQHSEHVVQNCVYHIGEEGNNHSRVDLSLCCCGAVVIPKVRCVGVGLDWSNFGRTTTKKQKGFRQNYHMEEHLLTANLFTGKAFMHDVPVWLVHLALS